MAYLGILTAALSVLLTLIVGSTPAGQAKPPLVISQARADLDGDGRDETLEMVLLKGRHYQDNEPWCGSGHKWEGSFALRVRREDDILDQRAWGELFYPPGRQEERAFFWAPLNLVLADYNGDGCLDFNLGVYGSCNANIYRLFSLSRQGRLVELPMQGGRALAVSGAGHSNSTPMIRVRGGVLSHTYYDNARGREITNRYRWQDGRFMPVAPKP
ncbi:MAG: hypothetical protein KQI62_15600 [Deltaproteobacteria bacterium]|nr:hypothetical protein [Deltaproteobacteria bacterium]